MPTETATLKPPAAAFWPSAAYSITMRVRLHRHPGAFAKVAEAIGQAGAILGSIDLVQVSSAEVQRDVTVLCADAGHGERVVQSVRALDGVSVQSVADRTFQMHEGGKIAVTATVPLRTRDDLSMAYTPGVARVCEAIYEEPDKAWSLTIKGNTVAVVSDGTAVLGLGDIGPAAAMPVMEGKALLFKEFAGVDAFPLCVSGQAVEDIVTFVKMIAPTFGGINLEDISAPRCFEIERRLREELDIPVFHDDQHGTAIVALAAFLNALKVVGKHASQVKVVISGAGAAGAACARMLMARGVADIIVCDRAGALYPGREGMNPEKQDLAQVTNPSGERGSADEMLQGADVFLGLSAPGAISLEALDTMAADAIVFAMANPTPEVPPEAVPARVAIVATGRSDYPNQINNVLAFPGVFRGALDARATRIDEPMKLAAAAAIAAVVEPHELSADYIIPSVFNRAVAPKVADAVSAAARASGAAAG